MKNDKGKKVIKGFSIGLLFLIAFVLVGWCLNDVVKQKWNYVNNNAAQQIVEGYYEEPENSLDVLYLGASTIRNGISPLEIWGEYGITGYSRATSLQLPVVSYYLLQETLETQDIKVVVMDATTLTNSSVGVENLEGKLHEALDYMPMSEYKWNMLQEIVEISKQENSIIDSEISMIDFLLPLYRYHDRWSEIGEQDFTYKSWGEDYVYKGQYPTIKTKVTEYPKKYMEEDVEDIDFGIYEESAKYFEKMITLCQERGIEFIMVKTPVASWDMAKHDTIVTWAEVHHVEYIDFCLPELQEEIDYNVNVDFCDEGSHPNVTGAKKMSLYLGAYLKQICEFEDKRSNENYAQWWEDYSMYQILIEDTAVLREKNLVEILKLVKNPRYTVMISASNDTSEYFNKFIRAGFAELGLQEDLSTNKFLSYVAVIHEGQVIYEEKCNGEPINYSTQIGEHEIEIYSFANRALGNAARIYFDGTQYSPNEKGLNIVVYDNVIEQFVSRRAYNTGVSGQMYRPVSE